MGSGSGFTGGFHTAIMSGGHGWSSVEASLVLMVRTCIFFLLFIWLLEFSAAFVALFNITPKVAALSDIVAQQLWLQQNFPLLQWNMAAAMSSFI